MKTLAGILEDESRMKEKMTKHDGIIEGAKQGGEGCRLKLWRLISLHICQG
jgi:hypothetical protein